MFRRHSFSPAASGKAGKPGRSAKIGEAARTGKPKKSGAAVVVPLLQLQEACKSLKLDVPEQALPQLAHYLELLTRWNRVMNLVGTRSWRECLGNLLADSFFLAPFLASLPLPAQPQAWDLGAGAGLPGIPLRMVWQAGDYYLVEAREKRALFLSTVLAEVELPRTTVFRGRAEDFFDQAPAPADLVLSRAFMPWAEVLALVETRLAPGGVVVFLALEPTPTTLPEGWSVLAQTAYRAGGDQRWLWALRRSAGGAGV